MREARIWRMKVIIRHGGGDICDSPCGKKMVTILLITMVVSIMCITCSLSHYYLCYCMVIIPALKGFTLYLVDMRVKVSGLKSSRTQLYSGISGADL